MGNIGAVWKPRPDACPSIQNVLCFEKVVDTSEMPPMADEETEDDSDLETLSANGIYGHR